MTDVLSVKRGRFSAKAVRSVLSYNKHAGFSEDSGEKMITKQELIKELKVKEPPLIRKELQEKLLKKWESDGKPLECGCGKEIQTQSDHYKQIQNNLFEVTCGKRRKLKMPERYDAAQVLRQLAPWIVWDEKAKIVVEML